MSKNYLVINIEEYPLNLLDDIAGRLDSEEKWDYPLPSDLSATVEYILATLTERESLVLHMRYAAGLSFQEVADELGVSRERIRQISVRALHKLSRSDRMEWLIYGVRGVFGRRIAEAQNEERGKLIGQQLDGVIQQITQIANDLNKITGSGDFELATDEYQKYGFAINKPIGQLGLSTRSTNCLTRKGLLTLRDLLKLTTSEVKTIRNLGVKSSNEVIDKVHSLGFSFADELAA